MFKFIVKGTIQGVGFRPYIYTQALKNNLKGYIKNLGDSVEIIINNEIQLDNILKNVPGHIKIQDYTISQHNPNQEFNDFKILESEDNNKKDITISPDLNICNDCLAELNNSSNKRHNYFFTTCTNCGPRYSIINKFPYDRKNTTMTEFHMCNKCLNEYKNPLDRRYHAQTTCCKVCGPQLELYINNKKFLGDPIKKTVKLIKENKIVAVKGIGGFHLICNTKKNTIKKLRKLKNRPQKPLALMFKNLKKIKEVVLINNVEEKILTSNSRPIVLLEKKDKTCYSQVSNLYNIGVMLPYTGLHYLLFKHFNKPLIATSSNLSGSPITTKKEEQFVPYILTNEREINNSVDDSVIKVINNKPLFIRNSRGYIPMSLSVLHSKSLNILSLGAEQHNTFCIYKNQKIYKSEYLGNINTPIMLEHYKNKINNWMNLLDFKPDIILCDKHPNYNSTKLSKELSIKYNCSTKQIQHHIAHVYSTAYEHDLKEFIGIAWDGTGYGEDKTIWGGEFFLCKQNKNIRVGYLEQYSLIGGDNAIKNPVLILISILSKFLTAKEIYKFTKNSLTETNFKLLYNQHKEQFNCTKTSSVGRILDAVACLLNITHKRTFDGEGALRLETKAMNAEPFLVEPVIKEVNNKFVLQITPLFKFLVNNLDNDKKQLASTVHYYLANGALEIVKKIKQKYNKNLQTVFSGGVSYNSIITKEFLSHNILVNKKIPPGDGGISFGQIVFYLREN